MLAAGKRARIGRAAETPGPYIVRPCVSPNNGTKHENELRANVCGLGVDLYHRKYGSHASNKPATGLYFTAPFRKSTTTVQPRVCSIVISPIDRSPLKRRCTICKDTQSDEWQKNVETARFCLSLPYSAQGALPETSQLDRLSQ